MEHRDGRALVSIGTSFDYAVPLEAQVPLVAQAGFTHLSLGGNETHSGYLSAEQRQRLKVLVRRHGLRVDTLHGPRLDQMDADMLSRVIAAATDLAAPVVVMHAGAFAFGEAELPARLERTLRAGAHLEPILRETGVRVALENVMPGPATVLVRRALAHLDPIYFGFCYDSAHDQIEGPHPFDLLADLRERVIAVHLSDRVRDFVDHVLPGEGFIDWAAVIQLLRNSPFRGPLLLEVMVTHSAYKECDAFLQQAYERGARLYAQMVAPQQDSRQLSGTL